MSYSLRHYEERTILFDTIKRLLECKGLRLYEFIDVNQYVIAKDHKAQHIYDKLIEHFLPNYWNSCNLNLNEFYKSDYYNVLKILFSKKFTPYMNVWTILDKIAQQQYSDVILDLFIEIRNCITSDFIDLVHKYGSYDMIKLIIEKYKEEPTHIEIKMRIRKNFSEKLTNCNVRYYYVKHYLKNMNDDFLFRAWSDYYCTSTSELHETRRIFTELLLHKENLRQLTDDWSCWICYIKYIKRVVLTILKRHRINYTLIGELNDVGQLYRIIVGFLYE